MKKFTITFFLSFFVLSFIFVSSYSTFTMEDNPQPNVQKLAIELNPRPNSIMLTMEDNPQPNVQKLAIELNPRPNSMKLAMEDNPQPNSMKRIKI